MNRFLLDTNMLLGFTRSAPWAGRTYEHYSMDRPDCVVFTSIICKGELLALAEKLGWEAKKRAKMESVLNEFPVVELNRTEILNAYAQIDAWTHGKRPLSALNPPAVPQPAISMKQNDLWVAATAHATKAKLLTTDKDSDHLRGGWLDVDWIDQSKTI
jgi:predicted nucleic acid-binding protein